MPRTCALGGRDLASKPFRCESAAGSRRPRGRAPANPLQRLFGGGAPNPFGDDDVSGAVASAPGAAFIRVVPDKTRAFVGEQVTVGWSLYLTQHQNQYETVTEPRTDGFWSEDIPSTNPQGHLSLTQETMGGRAYKVGPAVQEGAVPAAAGKLTITPMEAEISQVDFFGSPVRARRAEDRADDDRSAAAATRGRAGRLRAQRTWASTRSRPRSTAARWRSVTRSR